ncbi:DUF6368 family protein [Streptomyces sp. NPDC098781]|uniref:DUF6368 family protein n=1 Tax=Streptomyces sp. NPDC098781 TaxID=3366097 RepID=UPI003817DAC0
MRAGSGVRRAETEYRKGPEQRHGLNNHCSEGAGARGRSCPLCCRGWRPSAHRSISTTCSPTRLRHVGDAEFLAAWLRHPRFRLP